MTSENRKLDFNRREVMGKGLVLTTGGIITVNCGNLIAQELGMDSPRKTSYGFSEEMWANMVGEKFRVLGYSFEQSKSRFRRMSVELVATKIYKYGKKDRARPDSIRPHAISLLFKLPYNAEINSVSLRVAHSWTGELNLLFTKMELEKYPRQNIYEVVLN